MKLHTNYRHWIVERWFKVFLLGHLKDIVFTILSLITLLTALIIAIPYLLIEGITRLILKLLGKYNVVNSNNPKRLEDDNIKPKN